MEEWKRLIYQGEDLGDYYLVSNKGRVKSAVNCKIRKLCFNTQGYYSFSGTFGSKKNKKTLKVHKAVAETFIENPLKKPMVNHIDGNRLNNSVENLEWCTNQENIIHAVEHDLIKSGGESHKAKLTNEDAKRIRRIYKYDRENYSPTKLARELGVRREAIMKIVNGQSFKNVM